MGFENLLNNPEGGVETVGEIDRLTPLQIVRDASGILTVAWDISDITDPRSSCWETSLRPNGDGTLTVKSNYVAVDAFKPVVWKVESLTLYPNHSETTYEVVCDQETTESERAILALQAIRRGVELYTTYKQLPPELQEEYQDSVHDTFPIAFEKDQSWHRINYIFGIWKKEKADKKTS